MLTSRTQTKEKKLFSFKRNVKVLYKRKEQGQGYFIVLLLLSLFWCFCLCTGKGRTGNRWSAITYRIALAIFTRSPRAYEALKSYQILKLPSVASLKHFTSANKQSTGLNLPHLHDANQAHTAYKEEWKERGFLEPEEYGGLIFDEVKVVMKVQRMGKKHARPYCNVPLLQLTYIIFAACIVSFTVASAGLSPRGHTGFNHAGTSSPQNKILPREKFIDSLGHQCSVHPGLPQRGKSGVM